MITLHYETINQAMREVLQKLMLLSSLSSFRLVGGTSLSLQLGHRESVDIDLFTDKTTDFNQISVDIQTHFNNIKLLSMGLNGQTWSIEGVKVDIYDWHVPFLQEPLIVDNIRMATIEEIATYKFEALSNRRTEKDFIDIAEILKYFSFGTLLNSFRKRYPFIQTGAFLPLLLSPQLIERDDTLIMRNSESFEDAAQRICEAIAAYEKEEVDLTKKKMDARNAYLAELLSRKKKK